MDGSHIRTVDPVRAGACVAVLIPDDEQQAQPSDLPIDIVYEDDDLAVLNKPCDMPVHPTRGHVSDTLANAFAAHLASRGDGCAFRAINRLDRNTTGLVVACKNSHSASLMHGHLSKLYYAVCSGELSGSGTIDAPIRQSENRGIRRELSPLGQRCVTHWRAVCCRDRMTLLEIRLETGRTHQIRTHFADFMHMPLEGDDMYGGVRDKINRQALHCGVVEFTHPVTGAPMRFTSQLPPDMAALSPCEGFIIE